MYSQIKRVDINDKFCLRKISYKLMNNNNKGKFH